LGDRCATTVSPSSSPGSANARGTAHMLRHSRATELIRGGVASEVVSKMLTHRSVTTTSDTYVHLDDLRAELIRARAWSTDSC
jgi:integrase